MLPMQVVSTDNDVLIGKYLICRTSSPAISSEMHNIERIYSEFPHPPTPPISSSASAISRMRYFERRSSVNGWL